MFRVIGTAYFGVYRLPFVVPVGEVESYAAFDREVCLHIKWYVRCRFPVEPGVEGPYVVILELSPGLRLSKGAA